MQYTEIFSAVKIKNFIGKISTFLIFLLKTLIVGTEAVLTSTHNLCFGSKIRKNRYTPITPTFTIEMGGGGYEVVYTARTCFLDVTTITNTYNNNGLVTCTGVRLSLVFAYNECCKLNDRKPRKLSKHVRIELA